VVLKDVLLQDILMKVPGSFGLEKKQIQIIGDLRVDSKP